MLLLWLGVTFKVGIWGLGIKLRVRIRLSVQVKVFGQCWGLELGLSL